MSKEEKKGQDVSFLDGDAGKGYEGVQTNIPRLKILHFTSPEVLPGDEHVDGAVAGAFINTVTKRVYGPKLEVIPVKALSVWLEFAPQEKGGGFRGRHAVGSLPITGDLFDKAYTDDGNLIQEALEVYCLIPDEIDQGLVLFSMSGSTIKHGKNWCTKISTVRLPSGKIQPFYGSVWEMHTALNKNAQGQWYTLGVKNVTNVERVRFINGDEYKEHVVPAVDFCDGLAKLLIMAGKPAGDAKQLTDGTDPF